ncbi:hypothetical protein BJY52DRAFT_1221798 [Lactarius psammicola]|nr:hypothetical protein BJY52DRAFT_1221798 [Lactarius psammicola]
MSSKQNAPTRFVTPAEGLAIRTLHEATLQELIYARNYAVLHILYERNELMRQRDSADFPEYNYIGPPEASTLPYTAMWIGGKCHVLQFRVGRPSWAQYPIDRRRFDASTQTEDPDAPLMAISPTAQAPIPFDEHKNKKKKLSE